MKGKDLKEIIQSKRLYQWEIAKELNVNEFTLSRWLRGEVSEDKAERILVAINRLSSGEEKFTEHLASKFDDVVPIEENEVLVVTENSDLFADLLQDLSD